MVDQELAKQKIKALVDKYDTVKKQNRISKFNEENTKAEFIEPLFEALGWDVRNTYHPDEVSREEKISKDRVDYSFRINGIPKFFLEAKALRENLDNPKFVEQAINYSWHKGCTWAVLTDFESIKIFNAEWRTSDYSQSHLKTIACCEFLQRFDELLLLSKESFQQGLLDKEAEKWGKKTKKTPVDKQLLADFTRFRELLSKNVARLNQSKKLSQDELDEATQRILDRLIFIRYCEDKGLEERKLISNLREWESRGKGQLVRSIREVYSYFDRLYNSKIFAKHTCDELEIDNEILHEIIEGLHYTKDLSIAYDFSAIEADVLGNIYEQYLSHILKKTAKTAKLTESLAHRKEQGIFYTPTYIVDYIVRNTLGKLLEEKKINTEKIRILDPACGSGSFLIKAFDVINEYYLRYDENYSQTQLDVATEDSVYTRKFQIVQNNIFGVDLDRQAVEVAQLNLLLKVTEKGKRLPLLQQNIKQGNSLIDQSLNPDDRPFDWESQFPDIVKKEGFDVIIGNPPYVRQEELMPFKDYFAANYEVYDGAADLFVYFFERELKLLKEGGYLGVIVSSKWLKADYGENLRKFLSQFWIDQFIDFGDLRVFQDATTYPCIIIIRKMKKSNPKIRVCQVKTLSFSSLKEYIEKSSFTVDQKTLDEKRWTFQKIGDLRILERIKKEGIPLKEYVSNNVYRGIVTGFNTAFVIDDKTKKKIIGEDRRSANLIKPYLVGEDVKRYGIISKERYLIFTRRGIDIEEYPAIKKHLEQFRSQLTPKKSTKDVIGRKPGDYKWYEIQDATAYYEELDQPKIIFGELQTSPRFTLDKGGYYINNKLFFFPLEDEHLLAILNSKMCWYLIQRHCTRIMNGFNISWSYFGNIPIPKTKDPQLTKLSLRMLSLKQRLIELQEKQTDEKSEVEQEIKKVDTEVDELVYKLYGITEEEKKIIEESLK
jgi:type I restriction-modification system DNA methylase subunit